MMDRRRFIGAAAAGGASLAIGVGCAPEQAEPLPGEAVRPVGPFDLDEIDVSELQRSMESGERTARSITELYLRRIEEINERGPELRAIIETNPDALTIADELDAERAAGNVRGPLHGIPVAIKDNIDTHDRMTTTAGSLALQGSIPERDSFVAQKLRESGAIIIAKANLSEWANFRGRPSTSGWSARGGQCRNPYALDRNPCGSSSGSGVAASANLAALTIGTETDGSITCPAAVNGVVGVKPTVGLWSRSGIIPISHSQDTAGPMSRTVRDAAIALGAVTGVDPRDAATGASRDRAHVDYAQFLNADALRGARVGVARNFTGFDARVVSLFEQAVGVLGAQGAEVVDPANLELEEQAGAQELLVLQYEFKANLNEYLAGLGPGARVKSLAEVIAFNEEHADREMPYFGQEILHASEALGGLSDPEYLAAAQAAQRAAREDGIDRVLNEHGVDVIVAPTTSLSWLTDHIRGDIFAGGGWSGAAAAIAGYPHITVPMGFVSGLPAGLSFYGTAWSEPTLLACAYAYEQATMHRRPPSFAQTLG